jgi:hypothetical protein
VGVGLGVAEVVDGDDLDLVRAARLVERAQDVAADAAVAVDRHLDRHVRFPRVNVQSVAKRRLRLASSAQCDGLLASRCP